MRSLDVSLKAVLKDNEMMLYIVFPLLFFEIVTLGLSHQYHYIIKSNPLVQYGVVEQQSRRLTQV